MRFLPGNFLLIRVTRGCRSRRRSRIPKYPEDLPSRPKLEPTPDPIMRNRSL